MFLAVVIFLACLCLLCRKKGITHNSDVSTDCYLTLGETYLGWRYTGEDLQGNTTFKLVLLPYKSDKAVFRMHKGDTAYIDKIYAQHNIPPTYDDFFVTSDYNTDPSHYLILEQDGDDGYVVKSSLFMRKESVESYLHIRGKNDLYFDKKSENLSHFHLTD